jgi:predicted metal-dependent peptidase
MPEVKGGGGTSFKPFFQWVKRENAHGNRPVCIYFTDGYEDFPAVAPDSPVLWLVLPGGLESSRYPFGKVVRMSTDCILI